MAPKGCARMRPQVRPLGTRAKGDLTSLKRGGREQGSRFRHPPRGGESQGCVWGGLEPGGLLPSPLTRAPTPTPTPTRRLRASQGAGERHPHKFFPERWPPGTVGGLGGRSGCPAAGTSCLASAHRLHQRWTLAAGQRREGPFLSTQQLSAEPEAASSDLILTLWPQGASLGLGPGQPGMGVDARAIPSQGPSEAQGLLGRVAKKGPVGK